MTTVSPETPSRYLQYLPGMYQAAAEKGAFVGRFLKIFEKILTGINDDLAPKEGLEEVINRLHGFFDPETTPKEFLDWLAGWVALTLRGDWDDLAKRRLLKRIIPLYKKRGTKEGLSEYLRIFVGPNVQLDEYLTGITVGETGTVGVDTFVGGLMPHFFIVTITFASIINLGFIQDTVTATKSVLNLEKPAHTYYALRFQIPGIQVGQRATVGADTIIGTSHPFFV